MKECTRERNKADRNCTYELCSRQGICCGCLRYHWRSGELPARSFPDDVRKTYDRSVGRFVETHRNKG